MKVFRTSEVLAGGHYEIGDVVSFHWKMVRKLRQ